MKRILALTLVLFFVLNILPLSTFAVYMKLSGDIFVEFKDTEHGIDLSGGKTNPRKRRGAFPSSGLFYDQLDDDQKAVYNRIDSLGVTDLSFSIEYNYDEFKVPNNSTSAKNEISRIFVAAFKAYCEDHPERFWYNGCSYSFSYYNCSSYWSIANITFNIICHSSYSTNTLQSVYDDLMYAVDAFNPVGANRYELVRSIHDYIVNLATYDPNYNNSNAAPYGHQPTGCLLSPHLCVCEGYAEAFKLFADKVGIPCVMVVSSHYDESGNLVGHKWNYVLMDDNQWYAIDCTWDDPMMGNSSSFVLQYNYFLVGSQTVPNGESEAFSQQLDHTEDYIFVDSSGNYISYPTISTTSYAPFYPKYTYHTNGVQSNDYPGGSVLQGSNLIYITPGRTVVNSFDFNTYGSYSYSGGNKTGSTLKFTPSGGSQLTYTVIMRGDINKDAMFNNTDMNYASDISVGKRTYSSTAPETYAGDCNGDGVVDGFDLALLDRYQNGSYNFY